MVHHEHVHITHPAKKVAYFDKLTSLVEQFPQVLIIEADNVGSHQMAEIRFALRGKATVLMGKNTMIKKCLKERLDENPKLAGLIGLMKRNVGLVFCHDDLTSIRKIIMANKVPAPARQGVLAPIDVTVPAGPTGMDPSMTSFFQVLSIPTKIVKSQIEILNDVPVLKIGDRVSASHAALLQKLNICPFSYGLVPTMVYDDGVVYPCSVLDVTNEEILAKLQTSIQRVAAVSREIGVVNKAAMPHIIVQAFKNAVALALEIDVCFPEMEGIKKRLDNPDAFAPVTAAAAASSATANAPEEKSKKAEPEPEEEEGDADMGFSLFD